MTESRVFRQLSPLAAAVLLSGCASDFGGPINSSSGDALSPQERRLQAVENKTTQLLRRVDAISSSQTSDDVGKIREDIRFLRGDIETLRHDLETRSRSNKELYVNLDRRLAQIEAGAPPPGAAAANGGAVFGGGGAVATTSPGTLSAAGSQASSASPEEERAYLDTFDLLKNGKYDQAIAGFQGMLDQWPNGRYADNGLYWMGEAQLVKRDYQGASGSFSSLTTDFPGSPKVPDALYKLGVAQFELKNVSAARASLQKVIRDYPNSNASNLARQKLGQMGG